MLRMHGDLLPIKVRELRLSGTGGYFPRILTRSPQGSHFLEGKRHLDFFICFLPSSEGEGRPRFPGHRPTAKEYGHLSRTFRPFSV